MRYLDGDKFTFLAHLININYSLNHHSFPNTKYIIVLFLSFQGGIKSQLGPAFRDLQQISGVGLEKGSWIITSLYIGYTLGALLNGFLFPKFNPKMLFALYCLGLGLSVAVTPWCYLYPIMVTVHFITGLLEGLADAGNFYSDIHLVRSQIPKVSVGACRRRRHNVPSKNGI